MNIQQLEYLIAVDKYKHFGKAAQSCFITQPTLSSMIQKLEDELKIRIFDRSSHPIRTTDAGVEIVHHANKIINEINILKNKIDTLNNIISGKINIGIIPTVSSYIIPTEIFNFLSKNEKIDMEIKEMNTESILNGLKNGELDAGIISTPIQDMENLFCDNIFNEELMIYTSLDKNTQNEEFISPENIDIDKIWLLEEGNCLSSQFKNICKLKENKLKPKNLFFKASNIDTLIQIVDKIGGITILPELAAKQLTESQKTKISRFKKPFPYREISLIYYKPTYKQKILDELVSFIQKALKNKLNYNQGPEDFTNIKPN